MVPEVLPRPSTPAPLPPAPWPARSAAHVQPLPGAAQAAAQENSPALPQPPLASLAEVGPGQRPVTEVDIEIGMDTDVGTGMDPAGDGSTGSGSDAPAPALVGSANQYASPPSQLSAGAPAANAGAFDDVQWVLGVWVEMHSAGRTLRTQLTWVSPQQTLFLFTGADGSTQSMTRRVRDRLASSGALRIVPAGVPPATPGTGAGAGAGSAPQARGAALSSKPPQR